MESRNYTAPETLVIRMNMQTMLLQTSVSVDKDEYGPWITDGWGNE